MLAKKKAVKYLYEVWAKSQFTGIGTVLFISKQNDLEDEFKRLFPRMKFIKVLTEKEILE